MNFNNNITYRIDDTFKDDSICDKDDDNDGENLNITLLMSEFEEINNIQSLNSYYIENEDLMDFEEDYNNYNVKQLIVICKYYNLLCKNIKKKELITLIMTFEKDLNNIEIVYKRKQYWEYIDALKNDNFFNKYIIFNI